MFNNFIITHCSNAKDNYRLPSVETIREIKGLEQLLILSQNDWADEVSIEYQRTLVNNMNITRRRIAELKGQLL